MWPNQNQSPQQAEPERPPRVSEVQSAPEQKRKPKPMGDLLPSCFLVPSLFLFNPCSFLHVLRITFLSKACYRDDGC